MATRKAHSAAFPANTARLRFNAALAAAKGYTTGSPPWPSRPPKGWRTSDPNSFAWLVDQYLASTEHLSKQGATSRRPPQEHAPARRETAARYPAHRDFHDIDADDIQSAPRQDRHRRRQDPRRQDRDGRAKFRWPIGRVDILRVMFKWAIEVKRATSSAILVWAFKASRIRMPGSGNYVWTAEPTCSAFEEALYGPGTRASALAYAHSCSTPGQRSGDVVRMGRQHIKKDDRGIPWLVTRQQRKTSKGSQGPGRGRADARLSPDADSCRRHGRLDVPRRRRRRLAN